MSDNLGQLSVAHTETFYTRNVKPSGRRRSSLSVLHLVVCGSRSTRGHVPLSTSIDASKLHRYFDEKIAGVRASTAHTALPSYVAAPSHCEFSAFRVLTNDDVIGAICKLSDKQCATDPLPTNLLKDNVDVLAP